MLWLSRKDIEHISRRLLRDYLKKVPQKVDHIDPADFAEKMCGLQFTFADISEAHDAIGLTATSEVIITIPQRDGTRLDYELDGKTAFIDQSLVAENQIGRLNFTMMHEAAHQLFWMLYPEEYEVQTPRCVFRISCKMSATQEMHFSRKGIQQTRSRGKRNATEENERSSSSSAAMRPLSRRRCLTKLSSCGKHERESQRRFTTLFQGRYAVLAERVFGRRKSIKNGIGAAAIMKRDTNVRLPLYQKSKFRNPSAAYTIS